MQCQILFSGKNKKNISKCRLLKILPRVLSVKKILDSLFLFCAKSGHFTLDFCEIFLFK